MRALLSRVRNVQPREASRACVNSVLTERTHVLAAFRFQALPDIQGEDRATTLGASLQQGLTRAVPDFWVVVGWEKNLPNRLKLQLEPKWRPRA